MSGCEVWNLKSGDLQGLGYERAVNRKLVLTFEREKVLRQGGAAFGALKGSLITSNPCLSLTLVGLLPLNPRVFFIGLKV